MVLTFINHVPLDISQSKKIASANRGGIDGGTKCTTYEVYQGAQVHLVHFYNAAKQSSPEYRYLGSWETAQDLINWLLDQKHFLWWINDLLIALGYKANIA